MGSPRLCRCLCISAATFTDGTALTDDELDELSDKHGDIINMRAHDMLESVASDMADEENQH
jgi:hypothetical protein